jgi:hypothetical protein
MIEPLEPRLLLATFNPASAAALTTALNSAQLGDTIILAAGTTYTGWFTLPNKTSGSGWITIQSSALGALPEGVRVGPGDAANMPKIVSAGSNTAAITTAASAHHYKLVGLEVIGPASNADLWQLVELGTSGIAQDTVGEVPHHIVIDRSIIRASSTTQHLARGIAMNSASTDVTNSYVAGCKWDGYDTQAMGGWNGPGPFNIINNYIEGAGENVMFGGADPTVPNLVPSDIVVRGNHFFKPVSWKIGHATYAGIPWTVKNLLELKNARRVHIEGNIFENCWVHGQVGFALVLTPRNQNGTAPWCTVEDVVFVNNIVRHTGGGFNIAGYDSPNTSQQTKRVRIENNLFEDIGGAEWGNGILFQLIDRTADVVIRHNTGFQTYNIISASGGQHTGFVFTDNIVPHNDYGVFGDNTGVGNVAINAFFPGAVFTKNVIMGGPASLYNQYPGNFFPTSWSQVQFVNQGGGNYRLAATSPYKNAGTDGKDVGADIDLVDGAVQGTISGSRPFAYQVGPHLFVQFDGAGAPITLATAGANITATKGATTLSFSGIADITAYDSTIAETLYVNAPVAPPLRFSLSAGDDLLQVSTGTLNIAADIGNYLQTLEVKVLSGAVVNFAAPQRLRRLDVDGVATLTAGGNKVLLTRGLGVAGRLDLTDNDLILDYTGASPLGAGSTYTGVTKLIRDGRNGGSWDGNGVITSMTAAKTPSFLTTLGVAEAKDIVGLSGGTWSGQSVDASAVLIKYSYAGDADLSGTIDGDDFFAIDAGYSADAMGFGNGDFNYSGGVDADDYFLIDYNYNKTGIVMSPPAGAAAMPKSPNSDSLDELLLLTELL